MTVSHANENFIIQHVFPFVVAVRKLSQVCAPIIEIK